MPAVCRVPGRAAPGGATAAPGRLQLPGGRERVPGIDRARRRLAGHRLLDRRRQPSRLRRFARRLARDELGEDLVAEELERLADVLVLRASCLREEDDLVDARGLVALERLADPMRGADCAAEEVLPGVGGLLVVAEVLVGELRAGLPEPGRVAGDEALPDVGHPGLLRPEHVVVPERIAE